MTTYSVNLVPAYGRDYNRPAEVLEHWIAGKDFLIRDVGNKWDGRYTSIRDWEDKAVRIRYNRLADFVLIYNNRIVGDSR